MSQKIKDYVEAITKAPYQPTFGIDWQDYPLFDFFQLFSLLARAANVGLTFIMRRTYPSTPPSSSPIQYAF
jgi:hypothetical protein